MLTRRMTIAAAVAATLVGGALYADPRPGSVALPGPGPAPVAQSSPLTSRRVTLISGDVLTARTGPDGTAVDVQPGPGRTGMAFVRRRQGDHQWVIPADAMPLVARGVLDLRLFDVTRLLADHRDDASTTALPVIVRYGTGAAATTARATMTHVRAGTSGDIATLKMISFPVRKSATPSFWQSITAPGSGGITRVWLDGVVRPQPDAVVRPELDSSVPQIGAPTAWRAGYTGKGVKVAILDSGYDAGHPDLAGRVSASKDFTGAGGTSDEVGHGTHVASIVGGSGAASGGRYKGVAPDADLIAGRVCDPGGCDESAILAGMQWAVQQSARVVNMSLGGPDSTGVDPLEDAVNTLTAQGGTLFVVSAGNEGPSAMTIGSPGSADAALTVAAVDRRDAIADFSSRGPRVGDYALKPDIAAPGVGIVAARAHGTLAAEAVDANYAALSGTSMSAPHVTGAAALLAQQHPDWKADRLKEALVSSAAPATGGILGVDTGRVDVARAVEQSVTASDSLSFGIHRWPHTRANDPPVTRTVTYRNDAATDLTLNLALAVTTPNGSPRPRGMFAVPSSVTVSAHGSASVPVTVDTAAAGPDGQYTAMLTGTSADGAIRVRTALAVNREVESHDLTVSVTDRTGKPTDTLVNLVRAGTGGADEPADHQTLEVKDGTGTIRLPKGVWNLSTAVVEKTRHPNDYPELTLAAATGVVLDRSRHVTVDARVGKPIAVNIPEPTARLGVAEATVTMGPAADSTTLDVLGPSGPGAKRISGLYAVPTPRQDTRDFLYASNTQWAKGNGRTFSGSPYQYNVFLPNPGGIPATLSHTVTRAELATVLEQHHLFTAGNTAQLYATAGYGQWGPGGWLGQFPITAGRHTSYYTTGGGKVRWKLSVIQGSKDSTYMEQTLPEQQFRGGRRYTQQWSSPVLGPAFPGGAAGRYVDRGPGVMSIRIPLLTDAVPGHAGYPRSVPGTVELFRDGQRLGQAPAREWLLVPVPATAGTYRLAATAAPGNALGGFSSRVTAEWTFRSADPTPGHDRETVPVTAVQYGVPLDGNGTAKRGPIRVPLRLTSTAGGAAAAVASFSVTVSVDDGRTWAPAHVNRDGAGWVATYGQPTTTRAWVSLRSALTMGDGSTAQQTIVHAYRLR